MCDSTQDENRLDSDGDGKTPSDPTDAHDRGLIEATASSGTHSVTITHTPDLHDRPARRRNHAAPPTAPQRAQARTSLSSLANRLHGLLAPILEARSTSTTTEDEPERPRIFLTPANILMLAAFLPDEVSALDLQDFLGIKNSSGGRRRVSREWGRQRQGPRPTSGGGRGRGIGTGIGAGRGGIGRSGIRARGKQTARVCFALER